MTSPSIADRKQFGSCKKTKIAVEDLEVIQEPIPEAVAISLDEYNDFIESEIII